MGLFVSSLILRLDAKERNALSACFRQARA
jgi:hypothetical protein